MAAGIALAAVTSSSCGVQGLSFREDNRVDIVAPGDRDEVTLPLTVRWTVEDFDGTFEVLVDRSPQPPGEALAWFARNDDICERTEGCPDKQYLADRDVFTTNTPEFTVDRLPDTVRDGRRREFHEVTVVLLDEGGRRIGESAWSVEFQVDREED
ncbi:MAG: hypothetical protein ACRD0U_06755 [Acidimicrobiales bacterium]